MRCTQTGISSFKRGVHADCDNGIERIEFSWEGQGEMDSACGRGWAVIEEGELRGRIFFHLGDESMFRALKSRKDKHHE